MKKITSLIDILSAQTEKAPERVIYRFLEYKNGEWDMQNITMRALYHKSLEIAYMLRKKGLRPGDRAVIFSMQDYGTTYAILGCMMAGVTFTVIPPPLDEGKVARFISVLKSCQPKALISNYAMEQESSVSITGRLIREAFTSVIRMKRIYTDRLTTIQTKRRDRRSNRKPSGLSAIHFRLHQRTTRRSRHLESTDEESGAMSGML